MNFLAVAGLLVGCMAFSFFLGYFIGRRSS